MEEDNTKPLLFKFSDRQKINPLSTGINHSLSIGERMLVSNAPLSDTGNPVMNDLYRDVFLGTYFWENELTENVPSGRKTNRKLLEKLLDDQNFKTSTMGVVGKKVSSAAASQITVRKILESNRDLMDAMNELGEAENMENEADDLMDKAGRAPKTGKDKNGNTKQDYQEQADNLNKQAQQKKQSAESKADKALNSSKMHNSIQEAVGEGEKEGEKVAELLRGWGVDEGSGSMLDLDDVSKMISMYTDENIRMLTDLMGRVRKIGKKVLAGRGGMKIFASSGGLTDVVPDMNPDEIFRLSNKYPARKQTFKRLVQDGGLSGVIKTSQAQAEGDFDWIKDGSGSMDESDVRIGGVNVRRNIAASALALGIAKVARMNGQNFDGFTFGSGREFTPSVTEKTPMSELIKYALFNFGGGTNFDGAIKEWAKRFDKKDEERKLATDLVIFSDGDNYVSPDIEAILAERKERYGLRIRLLLIGNSATNGFEKVADTIIRVKDFTNVATELAKAVWDVE